MKSDGGDDIELDSLIVQIGTDKVITGSIWRINSVYYRGLGRLSFILGFKGVSNFSKRMTSGTDEETRREDARP